MNKIENEIPDLRNLPESATLISIISRILINVGISPHLLGYHYLRYAIYSILLAPELMHNVTVMLYPALGAFFNTAPSKIERAMRHAIEYGWKNRESSFVKTYFGETFSAKNKRPSNSEFIAIIVDHLSNKNREMREKL